MHVRFCFREHFERFHGFFPATRQARRRLDEILDGFEVARGAMGRVVVATTAANAAAVVVRMVMPAATAAAAAVVMGVVVAAAELSSVLVRVGVSGDRRRCCLRLPRWKFRFVLIHRVHVHFGGSNLTVGPDDSLRPELPFPCNAHYGA